MMILFKSRIVPYFVVWVIIGLIVGHHHQSANAFTLNHHHPSQTLINTRKQSNTKILLNGNKDTTIIGNQPLKDTQLNMSSASSKATTIATLTEDTTWKLRFSLNSVPTKNGRKVGELFVVNVQFIEEEGFEPPQGMVVQIFNEEEQDNTMSDRNIQYLKVKSGRWKLSEDPEDRKDGLWVWGLFQEPLYPFMLLQIETEEYILPTNNNNGSDELEETNKKDAIVPLTLYAQINHIRDKDSGEVTLQAATLNIREIESIKADPFGAARVDIFEDVKVGQLSLRPLL